jgi:hypothetical protein
VRLAFERKHLSPALPVLRTVRLQGLRDHACRGDVGCILEAPYILVKDQAVCRFLLLSLATRSKLTSIGMEQTHHVHPRSPRRASKVQKVRQVWTPEEDRILSSAVARGLSGLPDPTPRQAATIQPLTASTAPSEAPHTGTISWHKVATQLPGRNNKDCRKRWHYSIAHTIRKGTWSKEEDAKLLDAVDKYGFRWSKVAKAVGSRNGDQVFKRWGDCLDPRIDKSPWTAAEVSKQTAPVSTGRPFFSSYRAHYPPTGQKTAPTSRPNRPKLVRDGHQAFP